MALNNASLNGAYISSPVFFLSLRYAPKSSETYCNSSGTFGISKLIKKLKTLSENNFNEFSKLCNIIDRDFTEIEKR